MKPALLLSLLAATAATAQPVDVKDELWYPTNPPQKVYPANETSTPEQKAPASSPAAAPGSGKTISSPEDMFLAAYQQITAAQKSITAKEYDQARKSLTQALTGLDDLGKRYPQWQPEIVKYRSESTQKLLSALPSK